MIIACARVLMQHRHVVSRVVSGHSVVKRYADDRSIPLGRPGKDVVNFLSRSPFDYLFSVVNLRILSPEVLALPRVEAINFHDSLLPAYAGANATSWAIISGERSHGVTWHRMDSEVDRGAVLVSAQLPIRAEETALTLNVRCYEAGIAAFEHLLDLIDEGGCVPRPQRADGRSYFGLHKLPEAVGVLRWQNDARTIGQLIRALDFGPYYNPMTVPKVFLGEGFVAADRAPRVETSEERQAGTVLSVSRGSLVCKAGQGAVAVAGFRSLEGLPLTLADVLEKGGIKEGDVLPKVQDSMAGAALAAAENLAKHESFWIDRLSALEPLRIFQGGPRVGNRLSLEIELPEELVSLAGRYASPSVVLLAAHLRFISQVAKQPRFDIGFAVAPEGPSMGPFSSLFAGIVPFRTRSADSTRFSSFIKAVEEELQVVRQRRSFMRDLLMRHPQCRAEAVRAAMEDWHVVLDLDGRCDAIPLTEARLVVGLSNEPLRCWWIVPAASEASSEVRELARRLTRFLRRLGGACS
jgi:methionyl-tRNA formyltransferase